MHANEEITTMGRKKHIVKDAWFPPLPKYVVQKQNIGVITSMQIEPCEPYAEHNDVQVDNDDDFLQYAHNLQIQQNDPSYAQNIELSPLVEYLDEEFLNEFEMLIKKAEEIGSDDFEESGNEPVAQIEVENNDVDDGKNGLVIPLKFAIDEHGNRTSIDRILQIDKEPVVLIERMSESFIKAMTETPQQPQNNYHKQNKRKATKRRTKPKSKRFTTPRRNQKFIRHEKPVTDAEVETTTDMNDDVISPEFIINVDADASYDENENFEMIFGDVHDFDGPEITVGEVIAEQIIDVSSKTVTLNQYTCKMKRFQPRVILLHTPMHKMMEYIRANSSSDSSSSTTKTTKKMARRKKASSTTRRSRTRKQTNKMPLQKGAIKKGFMTVDQVVFEHELAIQQYYGIV